MTQMLLAIVIPIKNEEKILWDTACELAKLFDSLVGKQQWKFILVDNNSTDRSKFIIEKITASWPASKHFFELENGYSPTLRRGLSQVDTPYTFTIDAEQWDIPFIVWAWQHRDEYDLLIGSKRTDTTLGRQPYYRRMLSWGLNTLLRYSFNFTGSDTHGPKFIRMQSMHHIMNKCLMFQSLYDTEFVIRAYRSGLKLAEAAIAFTEVRPPRNLMFEKIVWNLVGIVKLYRIMRNINAGSPAQYQCFSREEVLTYYSVFATAMKDSQLRGSDISHKNNLPLMNQKI